MNVTEVVKVWCIALHQVPRVLLWFGEVKMIYTFCKKDAKYPPEKLIDGSNSKYKAVTLWNNECVSINPINPAQVKFI